MTSSTAESRSKMWAWTHNRAGLPSSVLSLSKVPIPTIPESSNRVLIRISHCSLNPGASILMQLVPFLFRSSYAIPEMDFAGEVVKRDDDVPKGRGLEVGTQVFGSIPVGQHLRSSSGALSEYVDVEHTAVVKSPAGGRLEELSGLGIAGATALQLIANAGLKSGNSVLVNGASGGIGHLVLQMCRLQVGDTGKVVGICSTENIGWLKEFGCDEIIDYKANHPIPDDLAKKYGQSRFDAVIDAAGIQDVFNNCPMFLADGKPYVTVGPRAQSFTFFGMLTTIGLMAKNILWPRLLGGVSRPYIQVTGVASQESLKELAEMMANGQLKVHVGTLVKMDQVEKAYERILSGHAQGKIVVSIRDHDRQGGGPVS